MPVLGRLPDTGGPHPVVVFCHGLGGDERGYAGLGDQLAGRGFAVLHPRFADAGAVEPRPMLFDPVHWADRVRRVGAVLDGLAGDARFDGGRVIVAGHSFGAYTAQLLLGVANGQDVAGDDDRIVAGVLLSPQGSGDRGLTERSWDAVRKPLLVVTATGDRGPHGEGLDWRREPFDRSPSRFKHLAVLRGGDHSLGGIQRGSEPTRLAELVAAFAAGVHGDAAAAEWLAAGPYPEEWDHER